MVLAQGDDRFQRFDWSDFGARVKPLYCGGDTRAASVFNGLLATRDVIAAADWVLVHDAARPCLGREEIEVIAPAVAALRARGLAVTGPVPADTAFTPASLAGADAVLAMYHDQGLPVIKHSGFGQAVNVTLGLPFHRASVDHGTALDLAGTGRADPGSLFEAIRLAHSFG